ncbi:MAG: hypothetical protein K9L88_02365 [Chromatiaceae bacterium]|nr:hypothetical protein [Chromatiaceae bacterium]
MPDSWKIVFEENLNGRPVKGEIYDEGGYRVTTTQKSDHEGNVYSDGTSTIISLPTSAGNKNTIDAQNLNDLEKGLIDYCELSREEAIAIIAMFQARPTALASEK